MDVRPLTLWDSFLTGRLGSVRVFTLPLVIRYYYDYYNVLTTTKCGDSHPTKQYVVICWTWMYSFNFTSGTLCQLDGRNHFTSTIGSGWIICTRCLWVLGWITSWFHWYLTLPFPSKIFLWEKVSTFSPDITIRTDILWSSTTCPDRFKIPTFSRVKLVTELLLSQRPSFTSLGSQRRLSPVSTFNFSVKV